MRRCTATSDVHSNECALGETQGLVFGVDFVSVDGYSYEPFNESVQLDQQQAVQNQQSNPNTPMFLTSRLSLEC